MKRFLSENWGKLIVVLVLGIVIGANFRWGYFILGNDNYSPELNPGLSLERFILSPGWRSYRVLGVASDADQADVYRTAIFWVLSRFLPLWLVSQGWVFACLVVGIWSMASLVELLGGRLVKGEEYQEFLFLSGGVVYLCNLLTIWMFFSPLVPFMAVWAFLPCLLWRMAVVIKGGGAGNYWWFLVSAMLFAVSGIVPTIFIVGMGVVLFWGLILGLIFGAWKRVLAAVVMVIVSNLMWILPFVVYIKTNLTALKESFINRALTAGMIEGEVKYNTLWSVPRFFNSWIEVRNDDGSLVYPYLSWFSKNYLGYLPVALVFLGLIYLLKRRSGLWGLGWLYFGGWFLIKGVNWPFGAVYEWMQRNIPLFEQVFRWQSSKVWPLMVVPMAVLAGIGLVWLVRVVNKLGGWFGWMLGGGLVLGLLIYSYPIFRGKLIQEANYVKVPKEYFSLGEFLRKNDSTGRIYLAPEANTLYFRNYKWGFWGSSVVNYLIPNPIVEKAMTTGSMESEDAQKVIENAYYSDDKQILLLAMKRYGVEMILSDESAARLSNGYLYDWGLHKRIVEDNDGLKKVWNEGNLSLYRLKERKKDDEQRVVLGGHNWRRLNQILAFNKDERKYYSNSEVGEIYPWAMEIFGVDFEQKGVVLKSSFTGESGGYNLSLSGKKVAEMPIAITYKDDNLVLSPSLPGLKVESKSLEMAIREEKVEAKSRLRFVSIDDRVVDLKEKSVIKTRFEDLPKVRLKGWEDKSRSVEVKTKEGRPNWVIEKDGVIEVEVEMEAKNMMLASLCVWVESDYRCLSPNISVTLEGRVTSRFLLPEVVSAGKKVTFYLEGGEVDLISLKLNLYEQSELLNVGKLDGNFEGVNWRVRFEKGDEVRLEVPLIQGGSSWRLNTSSDFMPEYKNNVCRNILTREDRGIVFKSKDCYGGVYSKWGQVEPEGALGMIVYSGENISGIPLDINLRLDKERYPFFVDKLRLKKRTSEVGYFMLPEEQKTYFVDIFSSGVGPRESVNRLENVVLQFIPRSWLMMKLVPEKTTVENVFGVNEAVSDSWRLKEGNLSSLRINGWEQGWIDSGGKYYFWPNFLAWGGYGIVGFMVAVMGLISLKGRNSEGR